MYDLSGVDGNAFAVIAYVVKAMKKEGKTKEDIELYQQEAMKGDYDHLLNKSMEILDTL